jgi:hypothetical protein
MMDSADPRGGGSTATRPGPLSPPYRGEAAGPLPPAAPNSSHSAPSYLSPSEAPYHYPNSSPSTVQVFPLFSDGGGGVQHYYDSHKRGRNDAPPPSAASDSGASIAAASYPTLPSIQQPQLRLPPPTAGPPPIPEVQQQAAKRSRLATYTPPRQVPKNTFLSAMGSLAVAGAGANGPPSAAANGDGGGGAARVPVRRQLSGSKLEGFLGNHDCMEVDESTDATRPRSMSF